MSDRGFERMIRDLQRKKAAKIAAVNAAFAISPAIFGQGYGKPMMAIKSGELSDTEYGTLRVTFFGPDGPHGHDTKKTDAEITERVVDTMEPPYSAMTDDDVIAWQSTAEFQRGSRLVAFVQAENTLRWLAGKAGQPWEWSQDVIRRANEVGTRAGTVNLRGKPDDLDALDEAIAMVERAIGTLPQNNPGKMRVAWKLTDEYWSARIGQCSLLLRLLEWFEATDANRSAIIERRAFKYTIWDRDDRDETKKTGVFEVTQAWHHGGLREAQERLVEIARESGCKITRRQRPPLSAESTAWIEEHALEMLRNSYRVWRNTIAEVKRAADAGEWWATETMSRGLYTAHPEPRWSTAHIVEELKHYGARPYELDVSQQRLYQIVHATLYRLKRQGLITATQGLDRDGRGTTLWEPTEQTT